MYVYTSTVFHIRLCKKFIYMTILFFTLCSCFYSFEITNLKEMAGRPPDLDSGELWRYRHDFYSTIQDLETGNYCRELVSNYKCSFAILLFHRFFKRMFENAFVCFCTVFKRFFHSILRWFSRQLPAVLFFKGFNHTQLIIQL